MFGVVLAYSSRLFWHRVAHEYANVRRDASTAQFCTYTYITGLLAQAYSNELLAGSTRLYAIFDKPIQADTCATGHTLTGREVRELAEKTIITWKARRTKFVSARLTMSTKGLQRILLESLEIDEQEITPRRRQPPRRSTNLPKFKIATFYATDVELSFNQIETQFDLHQINDDDEWYSLTCAALSGEVASDVRDVLLQPFQMPTSIRAHLVTQPDSATLESLAMLADRALASETDVEESKPGVAEINIDETAKLVGLLEELSRRLKKLETATAAEKKKNSGRGRANINYAPRPPFIPNAQATEFFSNKLSNFNNDKLNIRPYVPPQNAQQNNAANRIDTSNAPVCYFHQTFGDKARTCRNPCAFSLNY